MEKEVVAEYNSLKSEFASIFVEGTSCSSCNVSSCYSCADGCTDGGGE